MKNLSVWAPKKKEMILHIVAPYDKEIPMSKNERGYFKIDVDVPENTRYFFKPDGQNNFPDPASHYQPEGVHGPSEIVDHTAFAWTDQSWKGHPLSELILYEIHIGTFTKEGTFDAVIPRLDELKDTGVNAIELMPVTQFPGSRNWGYDGVFPYAVQNSYGGPDGLKKMVNACHEKNIAVFLDVVYNHLGPEGNYFGHYGPYFTKKYSTPWGDALNFDGDWSDGVRDYFSDNIIHWFMNYHIDGLRCDAVHAMFDNGAIHFWELAHNKVKALERKAGRKFYLIAESDLNSPKVVKHPSKGGFGFDAQWLDDFHHSLYKMLNTHDCERYYDFGTIEQLAKAYKEGFVHSGEWVKFRKRKHGVSSAELAGDTFVAFNLNHDQAGNRARGERLCMLVNFERVKMAAAALLLSPYIPMLFMGEEYGDETPFFYFVSHSDESLIEAVREGRKAEFAEYGFDESVPDPQDEETFNSSKIKWEKRDKGKHRIISEWHQHLIKMRKQYASLRNFNKSDMTVQVINKQSLMIVRRDQEWKEHMSIFFNFADQQVNHCCPDEIKNGSKIIDSRESKWSEQQIQSSLYPDHIASGHSIILPPLSVGVYMY